VKLIEPQRHRDTKVHKGFSLRTLRNFLALFAVKNNRKGNTKFFARPTGIIRAGKDHEEI